MGCGDASRVNRLLLVGKEKIAFKRVHGSRGLHVLIVWASSRVDSNGERALAVVLKLIALVVNTWVEVGRHRHG